VPIPVYDIAIIGGGINGCGIARDAAGRGLTVHLCEQGDLAGATSSASSKLFHGALRFSRSSKLRDLRERLAEQDLLLATAPHLVRPLRVVLPVGVKAKPGFLRRAKNFTVDRLGGRRFLPPTRSVDLRAEQAGRPLRREYRSGFEFPDCWVDDSRLVVANAVDARAHGAHIHTRTRCIAARRADSYWRLLLESAETGERRQIAARALVNATGPWVAHMLEHVIQGDARVFVRLVKGTHIVTERLYHHDRAYALQADDGNMVHVVPFERDFTLVGALETDYSGDPGRATPNDGEIDYLCAVVSRHFREPLTRDSIRFVYCGVRPIPDERDGARSNTDSELDLDGSEVSSPLLSVIGGNLATYRRVAERALARLSPFVRSGDPWTARAPLPGGGFAVGRGGDLVRALRAAYPFLSELHAERLVDAYGTRAASIVTGARRLEDLGRNFGADLTEAEVAYQMAEEWAVTPGDVLWRRTRLGLHADAGDRAALDQWMAETRARARASLPAG
jgi:glycerol-3-phosphate dehydrogenase